MHDSMHACTHTNIHAGNTYTCIHTHGHTVLTSKKRPCFCNSFYLKNHLTNYLFIYFVFGCAGSLLLCGLFSSCGEQGLLFIVAHRLLIAVASLVLLQNMGFRARRPQFLRHVSLVVVAHGLSCSVACWIFLHQGPNQCPLH